MATNEQKNNIMELFQLIEDHPELPIYPRVDGELIADDGPCYWGASWGRAEIGKVLYLKDKWGDLKTLFYEDAVSDPYNFVDGEFHIDPEDIGCSLDLSDEEADKFCLEWLDKLPWIEAIFVNIELPDAPTCRIDEETFKPIVEGGTE